MIADFICQLEKTFCRVYGHEPMLEEARNTLLYGQLNEGLKYSLIKSLTVSGASEYQQLCIAARKEERCQTTVQASLTGQKETLGSLLVMTIRKKE